MLLDLRPNHSFILQNPQPKTRCFNHAAGFPHRLGAIAQDIEKDLLNLTGLTDYLRHSGLIVANDLDPEEVAHTMGLC